MIDDRIVRCRRCKIEFLCKCNYRPPKYCNDCIIIVDLYKYHARRGRYSELGTTDFSNHAHVDDFDKERREVRAEFKKLGIKRQFTGE